MSDDLDLLPRSAVLKEIEKVADFYKKELAIAERVNKSWQEYTAEDAVDRQKQWDMMNYSTEKIDRCQNIISAMRGLYNVIKKIGA